MIVFRQHRQLHVLSSFFNQFLCYLRYFSLQVIMDEDSTFIRMLAIVPAHRSPQVSFVSHSFISLRTLRLILISISMITENSQKNCSAISFSLTRYVQLCHRLANNVGINFKKNTDRLCWFVVQFIGMIVLHRVAYIP